MIKMILFLSCLVASGNIFAANKQDAPPSKVEASLTYKELLPYFQHGTQASDSRLLGKWKHVATVSAPNCYGIDTTQTDWSGIKNSDGTIRTLEFGYQSKKAPGAESTLKILSVKASNLGSKNVNQGPYKMTANEPQFSLWGYDSTIRSSRPDRSIFFSYKCRIVKGNSNQLICGAQLNLRLNIYSPSVTACSHDEIGFINMYERYR